MGIRITSRTFIYIDVAEPMVRLEDAVRAYFDNIIIVVPPIITSVLALAIFYAMALAYAFAAIPFARPGIAWWPSLFALSMPLAVLAVVTATIAGLGYLASAWGTAKVRKGGRPSLGEMFLSLRETAPRGILLVLLFSVVITIVGLIPILGMLLNGLVNLAFLAALLYVVKGYGVGQAASAGFSTLSDYWAKDRVTLFILYILSLVGVLVGLLGIFVNPFVLLFLALDLG